jgi:hypothetical protein
VNAALAMWVQDIHHLNLLFLEAISTRASTMDHLQLVPAFLQVACRPVPPSVTTEANVWQSIPVNVLQHGVVKAVLAALLPLYALQTLPVAS